MPIVTIQTIQRRTKKNIKPTQNSTPKRYFGNYYLKHLCLHTNASMCVQFCLTVIILFLLFCSLFCFKT